MNYSVVADLHCHTVASTHAYSTITELAQQASQIGLAAIGCTDHGIGAPDSPHIWHFHNLHALPEKLFGVRILRGVEANVMDFDGHLDMDDETLSHLEVIIASMHTGIMPAGNMDQCTAAWLSIAQNPYVDIIGHSGAPGFAYDYEKVIPEFGHNGKAVEINENTFAVRQSSLKNCRRIAELCKKHGVPIVLDSDSHYHLSVGQTPGCVQLLQEVEFPPELIINGSIDRMNAFFQRKNIVF